MKAVNRHLKILILILMVTGCGALCYQIFVLKTPLSDNVKADLWTVDAQISFDVRGTRPVKAVFKLPPGTSRYAITDELFIANGYGQSRDNKKNLVEWSARKLSGVQRLLYRVNVTRNPVDGAEVDLGVAGETWRAPVDLSGAQKDAADVLIEDIRQKSSNILTFITRTIATVNDTSNDNVKLLLGSNSSMDNKVRVIEVLLSQAHIPMQQVHTLQMLPSKNQEPELWIASYVEVTKRSTTGAMSSSSNWYFFDPITGNEGLPYDRLIWWVGEEPLISVENGARQQVTFDIDRNELTAISLSKLSAGGIFSSNSFYSLPISMQYAYKIMLVIPFGVFVILLLRNVVGLTTLGTFAPVLIALAFRETGLLSGVIFFFIIVLIGLAIRGYLEQLKLQMLPRLSVVLTSVVLLIVFLGLLCHKLGFTSGLSITLFPMVILTMTIERLSVIWEERGGNQAFKVGVGTLITATVVYAIINLEQLRYFVFTFPSILLVLMSIMLILGRYRGYRLTELMRFKAIIKEER